MSYVKTVWETGDVITAAKLNNMEGGIEAALSSFIIAGSGSYTYTPTSASINAGSTASLTFRADSDTEGLISVLHEKYGMDSLDVMLPSSLALPSGLILNGWNASPSAVQLVVFNASGQNMTITDPIYLYLNILAYVGPQD